MNPDDVDSVQNPIVAMAQRIRARRDVESAVDSATPSADAAAGADTAASLEAFGAALALGAKRLGAILGHGAMRYVRLEKPLRIRLRFGEHRIAFDLDEARALVLVNGCGLDGEYQFVNIGAVTPPDGPHTTEPGLINLSKLSTEAGYGDVLHPRDVLKTIAKDAELPRPAHLDGLGPISF